jgi:hypothetical protein
MSRLCRLRIAVAIAVFLTVSVEAQAADRYAAPAGAGTACTSGAPCPIATAVNSAATNDDVIVTPGDYGSVGAPMTTALQPSVTGVSIRGEAGQPRPRLFMDTAGNGVELFMAGTEIGHLEIDQLNTAAGRTALFLGTFTGSPSNMLGEDMVVRVRGSAGRACVLTTALLRSSVCWDSGSNSLGFGLSINFGGAFSPTSTVRNVTALSNAGSAIMVNGSSGANATLNATNVIAQGGAADVTVAGDSTATVNLANSNYSTTAGISAPSRTITAPGTGTNQTSDPLLVDAAAGDFHETPASPTIDAGVDAAANGATDLDGDARPLGLAPDIGADESTAPGVSTDPAVVLGVDATLNATVNASGASGTQHWDYSTSPGSLTSSTADAPISGTSTTTPSTAITGLAANTTYYAQAVATNPTGTRRGAIVSFLTGGPPVATTGAAAQVTTTTAHLAGAVDPERVAASARFAYGTSPSAMTTLTADQPFAGDVALPFAADLTGLAPGTTYYAVARATNALGSDDGDVTSFTTAAVPGSGPAGGGAGPPSPLAPVAALTGKPRFDGKRTIAVKLACAGTGRCAGRLAITYRVRSKGRTRTVAGGSLTYSIPAGRTTALKLPLSSAARRALAKAGRLKTTLALTPTGASKPTRTQAVTLKRHRAAR